MDIFEAIFTRRSIRKFTDKIISDDDVKKMLQAAMVAPSAGNSKPWKFIVIRDKKHLEAIAQMHPYAKMACNSNVCIAVCADPTVEKHSGFWQQDCSAAIQNMMLAARGLGIGTVWTGVYPEKNRMDALGKYFDLPEHIKMLAIVVCGYPNQEFEERDNYDTDNIFAEKWGQR